MRPRSSRGSPPSASDDFLEFTGSVHIDGRLWRYDIAGSIAHAHALARAGVVTKAEEKRIVSGLRGIARKCSDGGVVFDPAHEDIHMNIEKMLTDKIGPAGAKLHTGRSRNDQVALDMRLMVRESLVEVMEGTLALQKVLLKRAHEHEGAIMPGYTHMQHAQPVTLSHHMLAHLWRLQRDMDRMTDCYDRTNVSPLGSGALAGTAFGIDRDLPADLLAMDGLTENSLDAVSDRDFVAEAAFDLSLLMLHLSSLCEELILWSSHEFGFAKLPKGLSSGSSMMPQKRNPDIPELIRGKSGSAVGRLVAILTMLKSLPLAYNRDLQEDKENLFGVFDTVGGSLHALTRFLAETEFDMVRMRESAEAGLMTATDLADSLVTHGIPFRTAHGMVSEAAELSGGDPVRFSEISGDMLSHVKGFDDPEPGVFNTARSVARRDSYGGTAPAAVAVQAEEASEALAKNRRTLTRLRTQVSSVDRLLKG